MVNVHCLLCYETVYAFYKWTVKALHTLVKNQIFIFTWRYSLEVWDMITPLKVKKFINSIKWYITQRDSLHVNTYLNFILFFILMTIMMGLYNLRRNLIPLLYVMCSFWYITLALSIVARFLEPGKELNIIMLGNCCCWHFNNFT